MRRFFYDIKAFLLIRKEIRKQRNTVDWNKFGLRHDWLYRVYTVINPLEKDKGDDESMMQMKAIDRCAPISKYIASMGVNEKNPLGLSEIVTLSMEKIPETDSFLVVYYQIFQWFTPWRVVSRLAVLILAVILLIAYGSEIYSLLENLFQNLNINSK